MVSTTSEESLGDGIEYFARVVRCRESRRRVERLPAPETPGQPLALKVVGKPHKPVVASPADHFLVSRMLELGDILRRMHSNNALVDCHPVLNAKVLSSSAHCKARKKAHQQA